MDSDDCIRVHHSVTASTKKRVLDLTVRSPGGGLVNNMDTEIRDVTIPPNISSLRANVTSATLALQSTNVRTTSSRKYSGMS